MIEDLFVFQNEDDNLYIPYLELRFYQFFIKKFLLLQIVIRLNIREYNLGANKKLYFSPLS
jgi:hypothetical protein